MRDISGSLTRQSLLVAAVAMVSDLGGLLLRGPSLENGWGVWVMLIATGLADAALAAPARWSGVVAVGHGALLAVSPLLTGGLPGPKTANTAGTLIAGYRAGAWLRPGQAWMSLAALVIGIIACRMLAGERVTQDWRQLVLSALTSGLLPWLVGRYTTARRAYIAELEQREQEAVRRAVAEERSAIARDLHDVISHHVSAIGVHAGAARLGLPSDDGVVRRSLSAVESASRSAMADLRRLLDVLHGKDKESARRQPGLDNLDELLDGVRAAGLPARLTTHGRPTELPGSLDIALYRIAQEALTNALRHGNGGTVEVDLAYRPEDVTLCVTNEAAPPEQPAEERRRGLAGIRQRVALFGGEVTYGPDDGRWHLRASFPLEQA